MNRHRRALLGWLAVGAAGFIVFPWYALPDTVLGLSWLHEWAGKEQAPALVQIFRHDRTWLAPLGLLLIAGAALLRPALDRRARANGLMLVGAAGFAYAFVQGFAIGPGGWSHPALATMFGALRGGQYGMGLGAFLVVTAFAMLLALGLAARGSFKGDAFVAGSVVAVGALVAVFIFFPVARVLLQALESNDGAFSLAAFVARLTTEKIWGIGCIVGHDALRCGLEHAVARAALRVRLHGARARLRVDRHAHALSRTRSCCASCRCCRSSRRPS